MVIERMEGPDWHICWLLPQSSFAHLSLFDPFWQMAEVKREEYLPRSQYCIRSVKEQYGVPLNCCKAFVLLLAGRNREHSRSVSTMTISPPFPRSLSSSHHGADVTTSTCGFEYLQMIPGIPGTALRSRPFCLFAAKRSKPWESRCCGFAGA